MLYNEFRPSIFAEVKGQDINKTILLNQLIEGKLSHTYIFYGLYGSGKTTCAKIYAKATNCENPQNGEPCNKCKSCLSANNDTNNDIIEIDAASFNKVENVATIKEIVKYPPQGKYKVIIMDEAHMLSIAAWNSLLKIVEDAPKNVIWIFASTDLNKFPDTILSRGMKLIFSRISTKEILEQLIHVCNEKGFTYEEEGLSLIVGTANGSMRDALSTLEKCVAYGELTTLNIANALGLVDQSNIFSIIRSLVLNDINNVLREIDELFYMGKDIYELTKELLNSLRDINVYQRTQNATLISKDLKYVSAFNVDNSQLVSAINTFYKLLDSIKNSDAKKVLLDINILNISTEFSNAAVSEFKSISDIKKNLDTTQEIVSKETTTIDNNDNTEDVNINISNIEVNNDNIEDNQIDLTNVNHFEYLPKKIDLIKSYSIKDQALEILLFANIYTKQNQFIINSPNIDLLDQEDVKLRMNKICNGNLNIVFEK